MSTHTHTHSSCWYYMSEPASPQCVKPAEVTLWLTADIRLPHSAAGDTWSHLNGPFLSSGQYCYCNSDEKRERSEGSRDEGVLLRRDEDGQDRERALERSRGTAQVGCFRDKVMEEDRMRWFGHVQEGSWRIERRYMNVLKENMKLVGVKEKDAEGDSLWRPLTGTAERRRAVISGSIRKRAFF